ncbi:hypothetical protein BKA93DRAFT_807404 [Sparassis latifolia]|uniref:Uncharacterized protein n=1 Tax=Sparassis crispa TaxID=139825 RepID=A0A401H4C1_9APHY|nr:hypothetical protein SCP_1502610 [Sparassis crispa]GBE89253.1 hypothetical protein SCP_1502610 [Sparassis crispa]
MASFSWSDSVQAAFSSCLVCLHSSSDTDHTQSPNSNSRPSRQSNALISTMPPPRARPDELEGLLADSDSADAETMSLHSNIGEEHRRKKRRRPRKGIRLFGLDLFGRPPIHLSESESEGERSGRRDRTISSSTLDSDASPLDPSAIEQFSATRLAAATAAADEERRRAKEERRMLRKERKQLKRVAMEMGLGLQHGGEEFEGFQGSGSGYPTSYNKGPGSGSGSMSFPGSPFTEEFGPFMEGQQVAPDDDGDAGADFGAESYTRPATHSTSSGTGSDSRSRTSASVSNSNSTSNVDPSRYNHHYLTQQPAPLASPTFRSSPQQPHKKQKRRSTKSKSHSAKQSESSGSHSPSLLTSQSPSIQSPPADRAFAQPEIAAPPFSEDAPEAQLNGFSSAALRPQGQKVLSVPSPVDEGFPSVGLRGLQRTKSDMGVFLARRGDD